MDCQKYVLHAICRELSAFKFVLHFVTVRKRSCGKVMFSEACVKNLSTGEGACMEGMCGRGACMVGAHAWQGGGCVWQGGMHGRGMHAWQGGMHGRGACMAGDMATAVDGTHPTGMHSC